MSYSIYEWFDDYFKKVSDLDDFLGRIKNLEYSYDTEMKLRKFLALLIEVYAGKIEESFYKATLDLVHENAEDDDSFQACLITKNFDEFTLTGNLELYSED